MKLTRLHIEAFQQFQDFDLDLTYPDGHLRAGEPLEKVCFIGANGTGKTILLNVVANGFVTNGIERNTQVILEFIDDMDRKINSDTRKILKIALNFTNHNISSYVFRVKSIADITNNEPLTLKDTPLVTLANAVSRNSYGLEVISESHYEDFWQEVIKSFQIRREKRDIFENDEKNIKETKEVLIIKFKEIFPNPAQYLSDIWDIILDPLKLYFDWKSEKEPFFPHDTYNPPIRHKETNQSIPFSDLSSGTRQQLLRFGYLAMLFLNRDIQSAVVLIDEPENSLFPDLLYNLVERYQAACPHSQLFFATHSPIVAAQFEPCERVILSFDEDGHVRATRGIAPEGDDPNDLLLKDFGLIEVLGKKGLEQWDTFQQLRRDIRIEQNEDKKLQLMTQFFNIGKNYKFPAKDII